MLEEGCYLPDGSNFRVVCVEPVRELTVGDNVDIPYPREVSDRGKIRNLSGQ